jgi:hypothetical protein
LFLLRRAEEEEMAANLEDVPSVELMTELLRRAKCSSKPDKRIILVGKTRSCPARFFFSLPDVMSLQVQSGGNFVLGIYGIVHAHHV